MDVHPPKKFIADHHAATLQKNINAICFLQPEKYSMRLFMDKNESINAHQSTSIYKGLLRHTKSMGRYKYLQSLAAF
jgi:hypothetical protein